MFDLYAELSSLRTYPGGTSSCDLAAGFVDWCTARSAQDGGKEDARKKYMEQAAGSTGVLPPCLQADIDPSVLHGNWLAIEVEFELLTPWYSRDDRRFHVLDNPVRKDRVFGVPYIAAANWKGMLRWACRIQAGLREHLEKGKLSGECQDPEWILHLFGNESSTKNGKGKKPEFHQGALVFYPTWFDKIAFEVINPHDRRRRAGKQPIYYEVVPGRRPKRDNPDNYEPGGKGVLRLLYAPSPGTKGSPAPEEFLPKLLEATERLLCEYGISAKRTVGWGTAGIKKWQAWRKETACDRPIDVNNWRELYQRLFPK